MAWDISIPLDDDVLFSDLEEQTYADIKRSQYSTVPWEGAVPLVFAE